MISVLMPSRQRPGLAQESIESLGKGDFEVLIWLDADDPDLEAYKSLKLGKYFIRQRVGYPGFHEMVNLLAAKAKGDWLLLWNDDALMSPPDWHKKINMRDSRKPVVLNFFAPGVMDNNLFPVVSRSMYEAMGHFSLSPHCDSWVQDTANELGIHESVVGIEAWHRRDIISDATKTHSQATYAQTSPRYNSVEIQNLRNEDKRKVEALL